MGTKSYQSVCFWKLVHTAMQVISTIFSLFALYYHLKICLAIECDAREAYLRTSVALSDWEESKTQQSTASLLECAEVCQFMSASVCNAFLYEESDKLCWTGLAATVPPQVPPTGLRVAWSSSTEAKCHPWFTIDNRNWKSWSKKNIFHTTDVDKYPWLAIDLITVHRVTKVKMHYRSACCGKERTVNIEVRVGNLRPFKSGTRRYTMYSFNAVCGLFKGPADVKA